MPSRSQTRSEAARGETLVLGALQVWGQKAACTFAYLPTDGLAEERILATKTPRWWEYSKSFHLKVADIWGARSAGRRASADWRIPNRAAPLGAMQVQDNGAELGLGWAGWLRVVARPADAGVTLVFELPAALATCPLRVDYGAAHLFEEAEEVLQITLPPGRHVFRAMDPSRENGVLIELNLEIRLDTAV